MSFDLALWEGPLPPSDDAAGEEFERRTGYLEQEDLELAPPTPGIAAFLAELLERFPPLDDRDDPRSPWAVGPEPGDVHGDFVYLNMTFSGAEQAYDGVVEIAARHGLVCFDPQSDGLARPA